MSAENGEAFERVLGLSHSNGFSSGMKFLWDGESISASSIKDGAILLLTFKVNDDAEEGTCNITVSSNDIVDNDLKGISAIIKNGEILISK